MSNGTGGLNLTIANSNGTVLAQTTTYIQIEDIKQMYERWTVGNNPNYSPAANATPNTEGLPSGASAFIYPAPQTTNTPYILFVHGYNLADWEKDAFAQTAFKRLYWQGYQGRFGAFQWPTYTTPLPFDASESQSWLSGQGLLNLLKQLNTEYPGQVYLLAHSLGNVAAGEALRLAGSNQVVNTYIAMQAAVDSHTYDPTTPARPFSFDTPDRYGQYYTNGAPSYFNGSAGAGTYVNFFNTNDWALSATVWQLDQYEKPDVGCGYSTNPDVWWQGATDLYFPTNTYAIFSFCDQAHAYALGAQPNVGGAFLTLTNYNQVDLPSVWPPDQLGGNYDEHIWHSAEFRSDYPQNWLFWNEVLVKTKLTP